jgi:septum formation protein
MTDEIDLYLASQSPRRRELLTQIGVRFDVISLDVPEERDQSETPEDYVQRLAQDKAQAGAAMMQGKPVLGADTIVVLGNKVLEKPETAERGINMLMSLSAQTHQVMTAVCLCDGDRQQLRLNRTLVRFRPIQLSEAQRYWRTGEPLDKAGGYGIQGLGAVFVDMINGSYSSVVGLPLLETSQLLKAFRIPFWNFH